MKFPSIALLLIFGSVLNFSVASASPSKAAVEELADNIALQHQTVNQWPSLHPNLVEASWNLLDRIRLQVIGLNEKDKKSYSDAYQMASAFYDLSRGSLGAAETSLQNGNYSETKSSYQKSILRLLYADNFYNAAHSIWYGELSAAQDTLYGICRVSAKAAGASFGGIATVVSGGTIQIGTIALGGDIAVGAPMEAGIKIICNNAFGKSDKNLKDTASTIGGEIITKILGMFGKPLAITVDILKELPLVNKVIAPTITETKTSAEVVRDFVRHEESLVSPHDSEGGGGSQPTVPSQPAEEKKRLETDRQKQRGQSKTEEQSGSQVAAEEALKRAKNEEERGTAEEARKKAEVAKIAAEQEAQRHQQEEAKRKAKIIAPYSTLTTDYGGVGYGQGATLRWSSSNTTSCIASGGWSGNKSLSGSEDTGPLYSTQTFILTCTGQGGLVIQHTYVSVSPQEKTPNPTLPSLTLNTKPFAPDSVSYGQGTTLQWSSSNATACTASGGWSGDKPLFGTADTGPLYSMQTFMLTCTSPGGSVSRDISIDIKDQPKIAVVDTYSGTQGNPFNLSGSKFTLDGGVTLHFSKPDGSFYPVQHAKADYYGGFSFSWPIPADAMPGHSAVSATDDASGMQTASIGFNIIATEQTKGELQVLADPTSGAAGATFTIKGKNFTPKSSVTLRFERPDIKYATQQPAADENGNLAFDWQSPKAAPPGIISISALDNVTGRKLSLAIEITAPLAASQSRKITIGDVLGTGTMDPTVIATIVGSTVYVSDERFFIPVGPGRTVDSSDTSFEFYKVLGYKITPWGYGISTVENTGNAYFGEPPK